MQTLEPRRLWVDACCCHCISNGEEEWKLSKRLAKIRQTQICRSQFLFRFITMIWQIYKMILHGTGFDLAHLYDDIWIFISFKECTVISIKSSRILGDLQSLSVLRVMYLGHESCDGTFFPSVCGRIIQKSVHANITYLCGTYCLVRRWVCYYLLLLSFHSSYICVILRIVLFYVFRLCSIWKNIFSPLRDAESPI